MVTKVRLLYVMLKASQCLTNRCGKEEGKTETDLHKHLGTTITLRGCAVHGHGLPVTGELQSDILLHELLDHLLEDTEMKAKRPSS